MALTQVRAQVNGVWYALTYDAAQRCYVAEIPAGETSADQPGGWYNVTVEVTDDQGQTATLDGHDIPGLQLVVKDLTAPLVTLVSPPEGYVTTSTPEIVVDLTDDSSGVDVSTLTVTADGEPLTATTEAITGGYRATITPTWADGVHAVSIAVTDQDGNTGTLELLYTVDTTPPVLAVWDHRLVVDDGSVLIRGMATDAAGAAVTASAGGWTGETAPAADGSWRLSVPLAVGVNEITVTATDGAGLTSTWTGTVIRLITDRVKADLDALNAILRRFAAGTEMEADWAALNAPNQRGAYNYTDLNRVSAAAELVYQSLMGQGISVDYARVELPRPQPGRLPDGYTELEYIESSGTQYVDTGFKPSSQSRLVMDVSGFSGGTWKNFYGVRGSSSATAPDQFAAGTTNSASALRADYFGANAPMTVLDFSVRTTIDHNKNIFSAYGQTVVLPESSAEAGENNLILFAFDNSVRVTNFASYECYSCQIYDNGNLVRDFVPCKDPSGNVGLYDLVGGQFYGNSGTGAFTAGPEAETPPPVNTYEWQETDIPTASQMAQYLANVANLLGARLVQQPYITLPASMAGLTLAGANNIEWALVCVDAVTPVARKSYIYSGEAMAGEF